MKGNVYYELANGLLNERPIEFPFTLNPSTILLDWKISHYCKLNCNYCFFDKKARGKKDFDKKAIAKAIELIKTSNFDFVINVCGGEPFLVKKIYDILFQIKEKSFFIIGTNLIYIDLKRFKSVVPKENVILFPSYHYQFLKKRQQEIFIKKFLSLQESRYNIILLLVYDPNYTEEEMLDIIEDLKDQGIKNISLKAFIGSKHGKFFPKDNAVEYMTFMQNNALLKSEIDIATSRFNLFKKKCPAGDQYFHINVNGDISICDMTKIKIGNVKELSSFEEIAFKSSFVCPKETCFCLGPLINIQK